VSHVVGPRELDLVDGKLPVGGDHYLMPPNALRLKWRPATGGDWNVTLDVRARNGRMEFAGSACECGATPRTLFPLNRRHETC
jgi:hypothetical protein